MLKKTKTFALGLISLLLLVTATGFAVVGAQGTATVVVNTSVGGTTDVTGTQTYPDGSTVTITAIVTDNSFVFTHWVVSPSDGSGDTQPTDNPLSFTVKGGVTYTVTPVFEQPQPVPGSLPPQDLSTAAIIVIFPSAGGTTVPGPGIYALANASAFNLTAMPNSGWQFSHWTICGNPSPHGGPVNWDPTDNPYNVNHGYGDIYRYQAIFTPVGSSQSPTPSPTSSTGGAVVGISSDQWVIIGLVVVIVVILIAFGVFAARRRR